MRKLKENKKILEELINADREATEEFLISRYGSLNARRFIREKPLLEYFKYNLRSVDKVIDFLKVLDKSNQDLSKKSINIESLLLFSVICQLKILDEKSSKIFYDLYSSTNTSLEVIKTNKVQILVDYIEDSSFKSLTSLNTLLEYSQLNSIQFIFKSKPRFLKTIIDRNHEEVIFKFLKKKLNYKSVVLSRTMSDSVLLKFSLLEAFAKTYGYERTISVLKRIVSNEEFNESWPKIITTFSVLLENYEEMKDVPIGWAISLLD